MAGRDCDEDPQMFNQGSSMSCKRPPVHNPGSESAASQQPDGPGEKERYKEDLGQTMIRDWVFPYLGEFVILKQEAAQRLLKIVGYH